MATPAQRTNTWILDEWYDQAVADTTGGYQATDPGQLYNWGSNYAGVVGNNNVPVANYSSPVQIGSDTNWTMDRDVTPMWSGPIAKDLNA